MVHLLPFFVFIVAPLLVIYAFAQRSPGFYSDNMSASREFHRGQGEQFESTVLEMQNDILQYSNWQARLTEDQINGWLAVHLNEKFPGTLPANIGRPGIAFFERQVRFAFRFEYGWFSGFVQLVGDIFCPETNANDNQIAIRVKSATIGFIPIPMSLWADRLTESLNQSGITTVWQEMDGDPVAIVTLPNRLFTDESRTFRFTAIELHRGEMLINGVAETTRGLIHFAHRAELLYLKPPVCSRHSRKCQSRG